MFIRNNKPILKTQQSFKSQRHNDFTKKINKIVLISNEKMESNGLIEACTCNKQKSSKWKRRD